MEVCFRSNDGAIRCRLMSSQFPHQCVAEQIALPTEAINPAVLAFTSSFQHRKSGVETKLIIGAAPSKIRDEVLTSNIAKAQQYYDAIKRGKPSTISPSPKISRRAGSCRSSIWPFWHLQSFRRSSPAISRWASPPNGSQAMRCHPTGKRSARSSSRSERKSRPHRMCDWKPMRLSQPVSLEKPLRD